MFEALYSTLKQSLIKSDLFQIYRLSKQLLVDPQQSFVFKVWHKGGTGGSFTHYDVYYIV